jgi:hypothetical protein
MTTYRNLAGMTKTLKHLFLRSKPNTTATLSGAKPQISSGFPEMLTRFDMTMLVKMKTLGMPNIL